jgi:hypothetical protein
MEYVNDNEQFPDKSLPDLEKLLQHSVKRTKAMFHSGTGTNFLLEDDERFLMNNTGGGFHMK